MKQKTCKRMACKFFHIKGTKKSEQENPLQGRYNTHCSFSHTNSQPSSQIQSQTKASKLDAPQSQFFSEGSRTMRACYRETSSTDGANYNNAASAPVSSSEPIFAAKLQYRAPKIQTTKQSTKLGLCATGNTFPKVNTNPRKTIEKEDKTSLKVGCWNIRKGLITREIEFENVVKTFSEI
jgi:hypothetical protein